MFGYSYPAGCTSTPYDEEGPEVCPTCGGANCTEGGVEVYKPAPAFCSEACASEYRVRNDRDDAAYAAQLAEEDRLAAAWLAQDAADAATALAHYHSMLADA